MKRNQVILLLLCMFIGACQKRDETSLSMLFNGLESNVKSEKINIDSSEIGSPLYIECHDELLIIANFRGDKKIQICDLSTGKTINKMIYGGRSEKEIIHVSSMYKTGKELIIYCASSQKILSLPLVELVSENPQWNICYDVGLFLRLLPFGEASFIAMGTNSNEGLLQLTDASGNILEKIDSYPDEDRSNLLQERNLAYQGMLISDPENHNFVYGSSFGLALKFFSGVGPSIEKRKEYIFEEPKYILDSDPAKQSYSILWEEDVNNGVVDMAANSEYCFVLYEENKKVNDRNWRPSSVYVFTWDGKPVQKMNLDKPVEMIAYNVRLQGLIALTQNDLFEQEFIFYPFNLKT